MGFFVSFCILMIICLFGWFLHKKTIKKLVFYTNFLQFAKNALTEIEYYQNKLPNIISKQNFSGEFSVVLQNYKNDNLECLNSFSFLSSEEKNEVKNFFKKLGRTNVENERKDIGEFIKVINSKIDDIKLVGIKKSKLRFNLMIMFGLFVFIILI